MIQLDTGLGTHFVELAQVPQVAREAEELGLGPCGLPRPNTIPSCRWCWLQNIRHACVWGQPWRLRFRAVLWCLPTLVGIWPNFLQDVLSWAWGRK